MPCSKSWFDQCRAFYLREAWCDSRQTYSIYFRKKQRFGAYSSHFKWTFFCREHVRLNVCLMLLYIYINFYVCKWETLPNINVSCLEFIIDPIKFGKITFSLAILWWLLFYALICVISTCKFYLRNIWRYKRISNYRLLTEKFTKRVYLNLFVCFAVLLSPSFYIDLQRWKKENNFELLYLLISVFNCSLMIFFNVKWYI
jgi:hypothetical protein